MSQKQTSKNVFRDDREQALQGNDAMKDSSKTAGV